MHPCLKQLFRSPVRLIAFLLLLALSGALLCIGANIFFVAKEQTARMEASYTTVAVPDYRTQFTMEGGNSADAPKPDPLAYFFAQKARNELIAQAKAAAEVSAYVKLTDRRQIAAAYSPGSVPITSGSTDPNKFYDLFDAPYDLAIFVVACVDVRRIEQAGSSTQASADGVETSTIEYMQIAYEANATVEECVLRNDAYAPPDTLRISGNILGAAGSIPLEAGKRYLIWGIYNAPQIIQTGPDEWKADPDDVPALTLGHSLVYNNSEVEEENLLTEFDRQHAGQRSGKRRFAVAIFSRSHSQQLAFFFGSLRLSSAL